MALDPMTGQSFGPRTAGTEYLDLLNSMLTELRELITDVNALIAANPTLQAWFATVQDDISARIHAQNGLTQHLNGNSKKGIGFADAQSPADLTTLQQVQSLVLAGGNPADVNITAFNKGSLQKGQSLRAKLDGTAGVEPDGWTALTGAAAYTLRPGERVKVTLTANKTLNLPSNPGYDCDVIVWVVEGDQNQYTLTVSRNGAANINGVATDPEFDNQYQAMLFSYNNTNNSWSV